MKLRYILAVLLLSLAHCVSAETVIKIPVDFISEITKTKEFKSSFNFAERIFVKQIMKNSSLNGVKLKKCNVDNLIKYFNKDNMFKKYGTNKLVEPVTGITFEFNSDGKCKKEACTIIVDLNPSQEDENQTQQTDDKMVFILKKNSKNELDITLPEFKD